MSKKLTLILINLVSWSVIVFGCVSLAYGQTVIRVDFQDPSCQVGSRTCGVMYGYGGWSRTPDGAQTVIAQEGATKFLRHPRGVGTNNNGGGGYVPVPESSEVKYRWISRHGGGLAFSGGHPHFTKEIMPARNVVVIGTANGYFSTQVYSQPGETNIYSSLWWSSMDDGNWHCYTAYLNLATGRMRNTFDGQVILDRSDIVYPEATVGDVRVGENQNYVSAQGHTDYGAIDIAYGPGAANLPDTCASSGGGGGQLPPQRPGQPQLGLAGVTTTSATFSWNAVGGGTACPVPNYVLRLWWPGGYWGSPDGEHNVAGLPVGQLQTFPVTHVGTTALGPSTQVEGQVVAYCGPFNVPGQTEFGELSNVIQATTAPPPAGLPAPTVTSAVRTCQPVVRVTAKPAGAGWSGRILRNGGTFGTGFSSVPVERTAQVPAGASSYVVRWSRGGDLEFSPATEVAAPGCS